jgi:hypothetical protein
MGVDEEEAESIIPVSFPPGRDHQKLCETKEEADKLPKSRTRTHGHVLAW